MSRKLLLNSLSSTTLYFANVIVAFIMSPVYIRAMGNRDYGLWELVLSVVGYMGLLDLGIGGSLVRFVSIADGKQDREDLQQTMSTAFVFFIPVGVVAFIIFLTLSYSPRLVAGREIQDIANLETVFVLLGINAAMLFPLQVFTATLTGLQRHYFLNSVRIVLLIASASSAYYLLMRFPGKGLLIMALLQPCFTACQCLLFVVAVFWDKAIPRMTLSAVNLLKAREMISFSAKSAAMMIASRLQNQSVPLIIGHVIGLSHIVYFVMPNRLIEYARQISQVLGLPLIPYFGATIGKGDKDALKDSWLNTTLALQIVSLAMPIVIFFCGQTFLKLWIGTEYAVAGEMVLYILLAGLVADSLASNAYSILIAQGKHGRIALIWLFLSAFSIPFGIQCAKLWGIIGVAAVITTVTALGNFATLYMACIIMQIEFKTFFRETIFRVLLPLSFLGLGFWKLNHISPAKSYADLFLHIVIVGSFYLWAIWRFTLESHARKKIKKMMLKFLSKN